MKKILAFCSSLLIMGTCFFASCEKPTPEPDGPTTGGTPTVSISADQTFADDNTATLTLTLSAAAAEDVKVTLAKAEAKDGITELTADYTKNVTIKKGETTATVTVTAETRGLEAGEYQAGIKIASATGAEVAENAVVYIKFSYEFTPSVSLYASASFASDKTASLTVKLDKAGSKDVVVTLADDEGSQVAMSYEKTVTVPAGQTEVEVPVTCEIPADLAVGTYPAIIKIADVQNGLKGNVTSVTINLTYPFAVAITVDGIFDDWNDPNIKEWTLPEGQVLYDAIKKLKLTANEKYVYLYMQFYDPGFDFNMPINIYIDADGNPATGAYTNATDNDTAYPPYEMTNQGLEWYCELSFHDGDHYNNMYSWGTLYEVNSGADGQVVWGNLTAKAVGTYDGSQIFCTGEIGENNIAQVEIQFERTFFKITGTKARYSVKIMDGMNNWKAMGLLPQGTTTDLSDPTSRQHVDMATIDLPAYVQ